MSTQGSGPDFSQVLDPGPASAAGVADVIVVGAGHNGLVCAAYLARSGLDVLVLEARDTVGGCASTVDAVGARVNICNCDHIFVRATAIADELSLADHGLRYLDLDPAQLAIGWDDDQAPWLHFSSAERTIDGLRRTHPSQVDGYRRYLAAATPVARLLIEMAAAAPSPRSALHTVASARGAGVAALLRWSRRSVGDVLRSFFTDEAIMAPAFATGPAVWGCSPETPGTGLGALGFALKHLVTPGRPVGGSGALPAALRSAFEAMGGTVRCGAPVERLLVERGAVTGAILCSGETLRARAVVAACDPRGVLVDWLGAAPPTGADSLQRRWRAAPVNDGYESKIDALVMRPPVYRDVDDTILDLLDGADPLVPTVIIAPPLAEAHRAHELMARGRVAERPMLFANVPSVLDPSLQVEGRHVFSLEVLYTPYALDGGWTGSAEPRRWLERYAELVEPGFLDNIVDWRVMDPPAYESEFRMARGYAPSFAGGPLAAMLGKDKELTRYETPVAGLFLTGAATFPGAGIWGASGRNAAAVVVARLDRPRRVVRRLGRPGGRRTERPDV